MDITPYVDSLHRDLAAAAEAGGADTLAAAERLAMALDPAARLALMEAISHAANEITAEMPSGSVDVRLDGRELAFVVDSPMAAPAPPAPPPPPAPEEPDDDGVLARITLRIPESVKAKAEEKAAQAGHSLNTWLVNVVRNATTNDQSINVDIDLSSLPFMGGGDPFGRGPGRGKRRMTGWV
ncbi:toxin-antitoxin system HicB family antitoxin [Nocardioides sp. JQ2195]|uniref:toxin-antitoxin system HicB family antitoxin n=1 Tax=Nocardioides sp. JQ2195 TaxID=2592334 RepID=UPI00143E1EB6|nr:toxin-antitoxin system HicB family antitoxin [Nocardioides sp. JQ2195]QIX25350.1 toxin-antitoxin system HicB family antitoxin [Nocardioides sp. JQ2195]